MTRAHIKTEAIAGLTTFFTMSYIVVVNPSILSAPGTGMPFSGVMTATVLLSFLMTLAMGLYAKLPFAVAPGMGINAFLAYTIILGQGVPWQTALGIIFWAGVIFVLVSLTPLREAIARAIPPSLRNATAVGIGLFLAFIGLKNAGLIAADPVTFVKPAPLSPESLLAVLGFGVMVWLLQRKIPTAFLAGIFLVTVFALVEGLVKLPASLIQAPDFTSVCFQLDVWGALKLSLAPAIVSVMFTDLFDSLSTFIGVSQAAGLLDQKGDPVRLREGLLVDAFATLGAGLLGTSSGTAFIESSAGIEMGGRTGLTSVFTALCFLPCLFLAPLAAMVPPYATAPVLVLVGAFMFRTVSRLNFSRLEDILPAFLVILLIPLTFSITQGVLWGFLAHSGLYILVGRGKELSPALLALTVVSAALLLLQHGPWH